jgi:hypothetical protein
MYFHSLMEKSGFSEFQFAFGLTQEIERSWPRRVVGIPYFPNQYEEAEIGSDVVIAIKTGEIRLLPIFLQYKISLWQDHANAGQWDEWNEPYYRFGLHSTNQHNTLVEHTKGTGKAFYIAPGFHKSSDYVTYHRNQTLSQNSLTFDCSEMSDVDRADHHIIYQVNPLRGAFRSSSEELSPDEGVISTFDRLLETGEEEFRSFQSLRSQFREVRDIIEFQGEIPDFPREEEAPENPVAWIRQQQELFFGLFGTVLLFMVEGEPLMMRNLRRRRATYYTMH